MLNFAGYFFRQQGGIIVAGPGKSNISYIHKVRTPPFFCFLFPSSFPLWNALAL